MEAKNSVNSSGSDDATIESGMEARSDAQYIEDKAERQENEFNLNLFDDKDQLTNRENEENPPQNANAPLNDQLEEFRQQWQDELHHRPGSGSTSQSPRSSQAKAKHNQKEIDLEEEARNYFFQGMQAEDDGELNEAIYYYKKALQLVPDIESKLGNFFSGSPRDKVRQDSVSSVDESEIEEDLVLHIENLRVDDESLCKPEYEQRVTHISALPIELITYILQWVVSTDLDLKSLEMFSAVCRGFFLCARDESLWKMACLRIWGKNLGSAKKYGGSWRRMMIERQHLLFSGCYISRTSYVRQGEQSLDNFYRPFHVVEYYRYARFFPDGLVIMMVSPDDPLQTLPKLRHRGAKTPGLLRGGYKITDNKVTCVMKRINTEPVPTYRYKRQQQAAKQNESESTYYVEYELSNIKRRLNVQLTWLKYTINTVYKSSGEENISTISLDKKSFPSLIFSHVRSYTGSATQPLSLT